MDIDPMEPVDEATAEHEAKRRLNTLVTITVVAITVTLLTTFIEEVAHMIARWLS